MVKRRDFLKAAALAAGTNPGTASGMEAEAGEAPQKSASTAGAVSGFSYPRQFSGRQLAMLAFPLGGVGAGSIGLGGRGQLRDWEIFNHPDKGRSPAYAFPAIRARVGTVEPVARVLESRLIPPFEAWGGLSPDRVSGLARLESATFTGEYPLAKIAFHDRDLPVRVSLEAFTPIIPLDADASGLPVAILRYVVTNPASQAAEVSIAFSLDNPVGVGVRGEQRGWRRRNRRASEYRETGKLAGLLMTNPGTAHDAPLAGSFALCVAGPGEGRVTYLRGWPHAKWWASPLLFWDDFTGDGQLGPEAAERNNVGSVCLERTIAPGAKAELVDFAVAVEFEPRLPRKRETRGRGPKGERINLPLALQHVHQFLHGGGALLQAGLLLGGQFQLVDLLDAARAQLHGHADEQAVDAVLAFQIRGAGQHLLLIPEDGFGHFHRGRRWRIVGAAGLQVLDDFGSAVARAVHDAVDGGLVHQLRQRNAGDVAQPHHAAPWCRRGRPVPPRSRSPPTLPVPAR